MAQNNLTAEQAAEIVQVFFDDFLLADEYTEKLNDEGETVERMIWAQMVVGSGDELVVTFGLYTDDHDEWSDPEMVEMVERAMAALKQAHPELKPFRLRYELMDP